MNIPWWEENDLSDEEFAEKRRHMVAHQIERRGIREQRLLEAMRHVPRHLFVPERFQETAYDDSPVPIGFDQTISQPYIVAFMIEALQLVGIERVLEIGTGSGYQAALLSFLCHEVYSIEIIPELSLRAAQLIKELDYANVHLRHGDGYVGWSEAAPFDRIILAAAPNHVPEMLVKQLAPGGRMILPLGERDQRLLLVSKDVAGGITRTESVGVKFVPMTGLAGSIN
jgi:protein-L-isoaspartate(D-aspartate) O-methyltransferase